jgi:hypothetical protein
MRARCLLPPARQQTIHTHQRLAYSWHTNTTRSASDASMVRRHRLQSPAAMLRARATDARLLGPASHPLPTREELAMRPRVRARLLPATCYLLPATCYPTPSTTPRTRNAGLAAALAAGALAACMLLLLPPSDPSASGERPHVLLNVSGPSPSINRNQAFGQTHQESLCAAARDGPATHGIAASPLSTAPHKGLGTHRHRREHQPQPPTGGRGSPPPHKGAGTRRPK